MSHPRDGHESRTALVTTAMRLFAEQGIDAVSVRAVNRAAGLAAAAVHYHFGSKDALLDAAIDFHGTDVLNDISAACDALLASGRRPQPREFVETFSLVYRGLLVEAPVTGRHWLSMIAQLIQSDDDRVSTLAIPVTRRLQHLVTATFPHAGDAEVGIALPIALVTYIQLLVHDNVQDGLDIARMDALTDFVTGGLEAVLGGSADPVSRSRAQASSADAA